MIIVILSGYECCGGVLLILFFREGDLRVIRPFVFVRENQLRQFAEKAKLPVISENCPACFEAPKVSKHMFFLV